MQKKVFITGATGLVGSTLCRKFLQQGYQVLALCRPTSSMKLVETFRNQVQWYEGDLLNRNSLRTPIKQADYVIHAGAMISYAPESGAQMRQVNIQGTENVVDLSLEYGCKKFCFIGSTAGLGKPQTNQVIDETIDSERAYKNTLYAHTKFEAEKRVWIASRKGLNVIIVNPPIILGTGDWSQSSLRLIDYVWRKRWFYPSGIINLVDIRDLADMVYQLSESPLKNERYIVSATYMTYQDFFREVANRLMVPPPSLRLSWLVAEILWRFSSLWSRLTGSPSLITREAVYSASSQFRYSNDKIREALNINFRPIEETLDWVCAAFLTDKGVTSPVGPYFFPSMKKVGKKISR